MKQIGLIGLVFIVLLVLKLTQVVDWSWWIITLPLWVPFALAILIILLCIIFKVPILDD